MRILLLVALIGLHSLRGNAQEISSSDNTMLTPRVIGIVVEDASKSAEWYQNRLGFELDTTVHYEGNGLTIAMLHMADFYLELIQFKQTYGKRDLGLPINKNLEGIIKFGFKAKDLSALYHRLKGPEVKIVAPLSDLPKMRVDFPWPKQHFIIEDLDGNYLQFFSSTETTAHITPFLFTLAVDNLDHGIAWYQEHLQFNLIDRITRATNEMAILEKDDFILEIGRFEDYIPFADIENLSDLVTPNLVRGFYKMSMLTPALKALYERLDASGQSFSFVLSNRESLTGSGFFMVEDPFGNSLQFWGRKN